MTAPEPPVTADHTPERLSALLVEHRRNEVDEPGGGRVPLRWRVRCEGHTCEFYAERKTWYEVCAAHEEHLAAILAAHLADVEARLAAVEALHREGEARLCKHDLLLWPCPTHRALHPDPSEEAT